MVAFFQHNPLDDGTWSSVIFMTWSNVEPGCWLLAACLICYRPLLLYIGKKTTLLSRQIALPRFWERLSSTNESSSNKSSSETRSDPIHKTVDISIVRLDPLPEISISPEDEENMVGVQHELQRSCREDEG